MTDPVAVVRVDVGLLLDHEPAVAEALGAQSRPPPHVQARRELFGTGVDEREILRVAEPADERLRHALDTVPLSRVGGQERAQMHVVGEHGRKTLEVLRPEGIEEAARNVLRLIEGRSTQPFRYRNKGDLATVGRHRAIAQFPALEMWGKPAWWFWLFLHIMYLAGFRNRLSVLIEWAYSYFTYQRGARLITTTRL